MAVQKNGFEGQTVGVTVSAANSAASGVAFSGLNKGTNSTAVYDSTHPGHGSVGIKMHSASSAACGASINVTATAQCAVSRSFCMDAFPTSGHIRVMTMGVVTFYITSLGKLETFSGAGLSINISTGALTTGHVYRMEFVVITNASTSAGTIKYKACEIDSDTPVTNTEFAATNVNAGTTTFTGLQFANNGTEQGAQAVDDYLDDIAYDASATNYLGAAVWPNRSIPELAMAPTRGR